jgi:hypothetical protein
MGELFERPLFLPADKRGIFLGFATFLSIALPVKFKGV